MALPIGMNARLFPNNWRPAHAEIDFAARHGFRALQFPGPPLGLDAQRLGAPALEVGRDLRRSGLTAVMEMPILMKGPDGRTREGCTPLEVLRNNLPAIVALGCVCVHWHLVLHYPEGIADGPAFEAGLVETLAEAVRLANAEGFRFGIEHNEADWAPFRDAASCRAALAAVPELGLVHDVNHATPAELPAYLALAPRVQMLHVSDTPLPEVNHHLPIGQGAIDFAAIFAVMGRAGVRGPAILEIGGQPKSGGWGKDSDAALIESLARLAALP